MKVVLIKDLKGKGKKGEIIEVNNSYAQNFLIPNQIAIIGNNSNINEAKQKLNSNIFKDEQNKINAIELKKKIEETLKLQISVNCGANGKIFGSITNKEISEELHKNNILIDKKKIEIEPIKTTGVYNVKIKLYPGISATLNITIVPDNK